MIILAPLVAIYSFAQSAFQDPLENGLVGLNSLLFFAFALAAWKWKRWGVYGLVGDLVILVLFNALKYGALYAWIGSLAPLALVWLVRPVWDQFGMPTER